MNNLITSEVFEVGGQEYEVRAVSNGWGLRVLVFQGSCQVGLPYTVEQHVRSDFYAYFGVDALYILMELAELHVREDVAWHRLQFELCD
jgi:hypothetical protein